MNDYSTKQQTANVYPRANLFVDPSLPPSCRVSESVAEEGKSDSANLMDGRSSIENFTTSSLQTVGEDQVRARHANAKYLSWVIPLLDATLNLPFVGIISPASFLNHLLVTWAGCQTTKSRIDPREESWKEREPMPA